MQPLSYIASQDRSRPYLVEEPAVFSLDVAADETLGKLMWKTKEGLPSEMVGGGLDLSAARWLCFGTLPCFKYREATSIASGDLRVFIESIEDQTNPSTFQCIVSSLPDAVDVELRYDPGMFRKATIGRMCGQLVDFISEILSNPLQTVKTVIDRVEPVRFSLTVCATFTSDPLKESFEYWAEQIGLPISVKIQPASEMLPLLLQPGRLRSLAWGANVQLVRLEDWMPAERILNRNFTQPALDRLAPGIATQKMPNGLLVAELNANETTQVYEEIFLRRVYLRNGVELQNGAVVIDVGANTGLFTLFVHLYIKNAAVHAIEPVPELFEILKGNVEIYDLPVTLHQVGIGKRGEHRDVTFYPHSSLQSGFFTDEEADRSVVRGYVQAQMAARYVDDDRISEGDASGEAVESVLYGRFENEPIRVEMRALSDVIDDAGLSRIDLLKLDVERGELDALRGIRPEHWNMIRQVVIEVHDIDGRVAHVEEFLRDVGFQVAVEQDELFKGSELFMVYAVKERSRRDKRQRDGSPEALHFKNMVNRFISAFSKAAPHMGPPCFAALCPSSGRLGSDPEWEDVLHWAEARIKRCVDETENAYWVDIGDAVRRYDVKHVDAAYPGLMSGIVYSDEYFTALGTELFRRVSSILSPPAKVIAVDCDNVLWGGICGEEGPENIYPYGPHRELQSYLVEQKERGMLLCLCSKNNLTDVEDAFKHFPDMPLSMGDVAAHRVNWRSKSENLRELAEELGLGLDSFVFIDDDPRERQEVRFRRPEVNVVELPQDPEGYLDCLEATWKLDIRCITAEDRMRTEQYKAREARRSLRIRAPSFIDYLAELDINVRIVSSDERDAVRLAQLSQRANQFNLTVIRKSESEMRRLILEDGICLSMYVSDCFGDYGLVGFASAETRGDALDVGMLMLSCRAMGRNAEWELLIRLAAIAGEQGCSVLRLRMRVSQRNQPALEFFRKAVYLSKGRMRANGFSCDLPVDELSKLRFREVDIGEPNDSETSNLSANSVKKGNNSYDFPAPAPYTAAEILRGLRNKGRTRATLLIPYVAPRTHTESEIAVIWSEVLGIIDPGIYDNFFSLGGDSLGAVQIVSRLSACLGFRISLEAVYKYPTIEAFADFIKTGFSETDCGIHFEVPAGCVRDGLETASRGQARLWAASMMESYSNNHVIPLAYGINGRLDSRMLESAIAEVMKRHHALRSNLHIQGRRVVQSIRDSSAHLLVIDITRIPPDAKKAAFEEIVRREATLRFDIERDPLLRATLIRESSESHRLLITIHHSACDGWSVGIIQDEISRYYEALSRQWTPSMPGTIKAQYADYVRWVSQNHENGLFDGQLAYWRTQLSGATGEPPLRTDFPRAGDVRQPRSFDFTLPGALADKCRHFAHRTGTTPFVVYLTAFQVVLAIYKDRKAIYVGCPIANRGSVELERIVGFIASVHP